MSHIHVQINEYSCRISFSILSEINEVQCRTNPVFWFPLILYCITNDLQNSLPSSTHSSQTLKSFWRISQNRLSFFTLVPWWPRGRMWYWLRVVMPCGWEDYWCDNSLCQWLSGVSSMPPCLRSKLASHTCTILVSPTDRHRQLPMIYINLGLPVHHRKPPSIASG